MKIRESGLLERMNTMPEYKLNWRYKVFNLLFLAVSYPIVKVMIMLAKNQIKMDDEPMPTAYRIIIGIIVYSFGSLYIYTAFAMLFNYIKNRSRAFQITENGIENTFILNILFALVLFERIKVIPWDAIKGYERKNGNYYLKLDTSKIRLSKLAKSRIKLFGYLPANGLTEPMCEEDFKTYIQPHIN